jgi:hypothetical protein
MLLTWRPYTTARANTGPNAVLMDSIVGLVELWLAFARVPSVSPAQRIRVAMAKDHRTIGREV